ncbi:hypothetical protein [Candidatus Thiosymbion oneisti]|uniref:hypothetical protein n=1 Tax=Candidatus Thiosymbion oneisti TaxID=589554 RepID=UPI00105FBCC8|nr:hypothetical protein [Candidatus Thiosymbion oneisti]
MAAIPIVAHTAELPYIARGKTRVRRDAGVGRSPQPGRADPRPRPVLEAGPNPGVTFADTGGLPVLLVDDSAPQPRPGLALSLTNAGLAVDKPSTGPEAWDPLQVQAHVCSLIPIAEKLDLPGTDPSWVRVIQLRTLAAPTADYRL